MKNIFNSITITLPNGIPLGDATAVDMREAVKLLRAIARLNDEMLRQYQALVKQCGRTTLRNNIRSLEAVKKLQKAKQHMDALLNRNCPRAIS